MSLVLEVYADSSVHAERGATLPFSCTAPISNAAVVVVAVAVVVVAVAVVVGASTASSSLSGRLRRKRTTSMTVSEERSITVERIFADDVVVDEDDDDDANADGGRLKSTPSSSCPSSSVGRGRTRRRRRPFPSSRSIAILAFEICGKDTKASVVVVVDAAKTEARRARRARTMVDEKKSCSGGIGGNEISPKTHLRTRSYVGTKHIMIPL